MRKSYKLYNHESCNAHVEIHRDDKGLFKAIELWSYETCVCGLAFENGWKIFCNGTYSPTTRRHISWFSRQPWNPYRNWVLSYQEFKWISEHCAHGIREATQNEIACFANLIWQYEQSGKHCYIYG